MYQLVSLWTAWTRKNVKAFIAIATIWPIILMQATKTLILEINYWMIIMEWKSLWNETFWMIILMIMFVLSLLVIFGPLLELEHSNQEIQSSSIKWCRIRSILEKYATIVASKVNEMCYSSSIPPVLFRHYFSLSCKSRSVSSRVSRCNRWGCCKVYQWSTVMISDKFNTVILLSCG